MLDIERALRNERLLRALTGLNRKGFEQICGVFEGVYQAELAKDTLAPSPCERRGSQSTTAKDIGQGIFHSVLFQVLSNI